MTQKNNDYATMTKNDCATRLRNVMRREPYVESFRESSLCLVSHFVS